MVSKFHFIDPEHLGGRLILFWGRGNTDKSDILLRFNAKEVLRLIKISTGLRSQAELIYSDRNQIRAWLRGK